MTRAIIGGYDRHVLRRIVKQRDGGVCADCGLRGLSMPKWLRKNKTNESARRRWIVKNMPRRFRIDEWRDPDAWWEMDHIRPIREGGANVPENIRTLCPKCHETLNQSERP